MQPAALPPISALRAPSTLSAPAFTPPRVVWRAAVNPASPASPARDATPWLCWQTSSLSLVSLAAMDGDPVGDEHPARRLPVDLARALAHLRDAAAALDWPVFATLQPRDAGHLWLVMGASADTTTVLQRDDHAAIELPLTLQLKRRRDGGCEARWHAAGTLTGRGLPDGLIAQVARLPRLLDHAWH
ncbi:hypothetical protein [Sphaerotilus microaerophilus]|jgi:hypothetical protein|uniref:hypothetical protein n=1 Tax=Sphaerotilus microaerophilus TaxID=2914710 RepID=UPI002074407B|nr:hypothetical protein [Sphaerotilus sp. FB-5]